MNKSVLSQCQSKQALWWSLVSRVASEILNNEDTAVNVMAMS